MHTWIQFCFGGHGLEHAKACPIMNSVITIAMTATSSSLIFILI